MISRALSYIRLRVFAWGVFDRVFLRIAWVFLRISAYFCVLLQAAVSGRKIKDKTKP